MCTGPSVRTLERRIRTTGKTMWICLGIVALLGELCLARSVPEPCCMVNQWEAVMGSTDSYISAQSSHIRVGTKRISMDYVNKKMAVSTHYDGESTGSKFIIDFVRKKEYNIDGMNCTESPVFLEMTPRCIPGNAQYLGSSYMGGGNNRIAFSSWNFFLTGWNTNITIALSQSDCTPLAEGVITLTKGNVCILSSMMAVFTTFTSGINDPNVFVPPPGCQSVNKQKSAENISVNTHENNTT